MILLDTHALVWWVSDSGKLSPRARRSILAATRQGPAIVSAISLFEIATLFRRRKLALSVPAGQWLSDVRLLPQVRIEPVGAAIAALAGSLNDELPGDPGDRIIAATALELDAVLISADRRLRAVPRLQVIW